MALSADYRHYVFLDSSQRNRTRYPYPSEFETIIKGGDGDYTTDPVGNGYVLFQSLITAYNNAATPHSVTLTTAISVSFSENSLLDKYIEIIDPATLAIRGTARVAGFGSASPIVTIFLSEPIAGVVAPTDMIIVRQISTTPKFRFIQTPAIGAATTTLTIIGGSTRANEYVNNYLRVLGSTQSYRIVSYNATTLVATVTPAIPSIADLSIVEIYDVQENYHGLTNAGSQLSKTSMCNHDIRLEWLRIPRHPLFVNNVDANAPPVSASKLISEFPYVIIEFRNVNEGSNNVIQSNTKATRRAQFILPVDDLSTATPGRFITLRSNYSIVMKFNPIDPIRFLVTIPDGTPIKFDPDDESLNLSQVNPDIQISALFSVKRVLN